VIINIRGTNGSGKSTVIQKLMAQFPARPIFGVLGPRRPEAYEFDRTIKASKPVFLLGPYLTPVGGADCIQPFDLIPTLIEKYAERGHVLFEGVLVSKTNGQVGACLAQWGKNSILLYLDTPMDVCVAAVKARRAARGDVRAFNPKNLIEAYKSTARVRKTLLAEDKLRIIDVSRENAVATVLSLLGK
jgi:thymidylate kinase